MSNKTNNPIYRVVEVYTSGDLKGREAQCFYEGESPAEAFHEFEATRIYGSNSELRVYKGQKITHRIKAKDQ